MVASRVFSWAPSCPRDLMPYCFNRKPPASLTSNSASLRLPAPKSTARNDFDCSIGCRYPPHGSMVPLTLRQSVVIIGKQQWGQTENSFLRCSALEKSNRLLCHKKFARRDCKGVIGDEKFGAVREN